MQNTILPHALPRALDDAPASCGILSLDCFDTLLWRTTHAPADVFVDVGSAGGTSQQRRWAESHARSRSALHRQSNEAAIADIYEMLLPNAAPNVREAGVAAELAAEARHCFAFAPTIELMREAKRRGLQVIVVSDTYFSRDQLDWLISTAAGEEVRALIDRIFCSSEFGVAKPEGLFGHVLGQLDVPADTILHLGDNVVADYHAPQRLGIPARHLVQFTNETQQRLRLEAAAGAVLHAGPCESAAYQLHRAAVSVAEPQIEDRGALLGFSVLGPVLAAFDAWLRAEVRGLQAETRGRVHLHFLMRDGHLPHELHLALGTLNDVRVAAVEISRYAATAAGLTSRALIERFLERELGAGDYAGIARQLLFDRRETTALLGKPADPRAQCATFLANVRTPANINKILSRSASFRQRLIRHLRGASDPQPGDTVVLVDLGYGGTVQSWIEPLLRQELQVEVTGRYLLLREQELSGHEKRGLFDTRNYDLQTLNALCSNAAAIEQLCTIAQGSVVDYREDGTPVRTESGIKARQSAVREQVQQGCIRFAREGRDAVLRVPTTMAAEQERRSAAATLARFMYLPQPGEVEVLRQFEHDINLGGGETVPLFDAALAEQDLRREGMFYVKQAERMYVPAELQMHGLPLSLSLLTQRRFDLDLRRADFRGTGLSLPIIVADGRQVSTTRVEAHRTHDGFFAAVIPVGTSQYAIGLQFGLLYDWVEVQSASFQSARSLAEDSGKPADRPAIPASPSYEGMEAVSSNLMRCTEPSGFMMVPPPPAKGEAMVLTVVFRPIVSRQPTSDPVQSRTAAVAGARS
jgi:FMN phosphatase YigB (HAD superfamily)